ncbi:MAG TPA: hypothetical protein VHG92_04085 [Afifellaceae bacterium]|nr:hypothetical protein [Afifellaceae bacterium]
MSIRLSRSFCAGITALALLAPVSSAVAQYSPAAGEGRHAARMPGDLFVPVAPGWTTYVNARSGASLTYPEELFQPLPSENGENQRFISRDGEAELEFIVLPRAPGQTARSLQQSLVGREGYEQVTYAPRGRSWFVLSGYRGDRVFYEKYVFAGGSVQAFAIAYPQSLRQLYDPVVEAVEDNFRPAR